MRTTRRDFLKFVGFATAALAAGPQISPAKQPRKPNVLLIYTDDQGTLDVNCYGSTDLYTPAMDNLAKTGVRFTQAYAHTVCCPSRSMLLTGRHPQRSNVNNWMQGNAKDAKKGLNMFKSELTIAEVLKSAGYKTALFGKWHLGAHRNHGPTEQGFDEFFGHRGGFIDNYNHHFLHGRGFHDLYEGTTEVYAKGTYFPDMTTNRALDFIERNKENPFFLYLAFNIPHYPEQTDTKFDDRYKNMPMPRRAYAKMISTVDDRIGRVVAKLEELGLREDTIIILMSDNGHSEESSRISVDNHSSGLPKGHNYGANGGGGNTGKWRGAKGSFFEGGIRVPAIISYPRQLPRAAVRDQAITAADWFPTILDLCKVPLPKVKLDGQTLLPIIESAEAPTHHTVLHWQWQNKWAVRKDQWKLIGRADKPTFLANLKDPQPEQKNYLREKSEITASLKRLHDDWAHEVKPEQ
ncbi:MAG: sulfatase-like hydrolase/transferase [Planctomycetota bacterium]|jgi:arylsulfatase A-like enzyme